MNRLVSFILLIVITSTVSFSQESDSVSVARKFELGEIVVTSAKSKNTLTQLNSIQLNQTTVSNALNTIPSIVLHNIGERNELSVIIRGFDIRSIPVYIDGIPVYVTYDGYVDLGRFKTFDYSVISATKGLTPMEYGPNTIGGSINLVSLKPTEKIDIQAIAGYGSGNSYEYGVNAGSRIDKFYFQGSFYGVKSDFFPLSKNYVPTTHEDGNERENSYSADQKVNVKVGFSPNEKNEYAINYIFQNAEKGTPPYSGSDSKQSARFWQWPVWNKQSVYFISKTNIAAHTNLKFRLFYDEFYNKLKSFDDKTYSTQNMRYAFTSIYDDHTWGGNTVLSYTFADKNKLNLSLHYKNDFHKENNEGEPVRNFNDYTVSAGFDDEFSVTSKLNLTAGLSYNFRKSLEAENYNPNTGEISDFPLNQNSAVNAQIATGYSFLKNNTITFYLAHRTRFATLKDRYSYRLGRTIPNPELEPEQAMHYNLSYKSLFFEKLSVDASLFFIQLNNTIQQVDNVEPGISQMQNTGKAEFKGFELTADYAFAKWASLSANYSYIERKNLSNPELFFTNVPNHKVWANLKATPVKNLEINLNAEYNSERFSTSYGTVAGAFDLYNLHASYNLKQFTIFTGIQNLLDENFAYTEGYPAPGRNSFVKIMFRLN
jgi:iron complex outermembrane receptor protein